MRTVKPILAFLCLSLLSGCGGGGSGSSATTSGSNGLGSGTSGGTSTAGGISNAATGGISSTFGTSNAGPGVQSGAGATSGTGATTATPAVVTAIEISPATATLEANRRLTLTALAKDASGNPVAVPDENWQWTSSAPGVAVLTSQGATATISGVQAGTALITVIEGKSQTRAQITLTVTAFGSGSSSSPGGSGLGGDGSGSGTSGSGGTSGTGGSGTGGSGSGGSGSGGSGSGGTGGSGGSGGTGTSAGSTVVYANDFVNPVGSEWSNTHTETTPGTASHPPTPFLGRFSVGTVSLNLGKLAAHTSATIEFDLFIIGSWDGNVTIPGVGPDVWDLGVDGGPTPAAHVVLQYHSGAGNQSRRISAGIFPGVSRQLSDRKPSLPSRRGGSEHAWLCLCERPDRRGATI